MKSIDFSGFCGLQQICPASSLRRHSTKIVGCCFQKQSNPERICSEPIISRCIVNWHRNGGNSMGYYTKIKIGNTVQKVDAVFLEFYRTCPCCGAEIHEPSIWISKLPCSPVKLTDEKAFCESCRDLPEKEQKVVCEIQGINRNWIRYSRN